MPGRTSVQRSGRGSPVTTVNCASKARWTLANRSSSIPLPASRAADSSPETSSSTPSAWATVPP